MWDCEHCGTQSIAASIMVCPVCQTPRPDPNAGNVPTSEVLAEEGGPAGEAGALGGAESSDPDPASEEDAPSQADTAGEPQQQASNSGW
jgi:hypothetical protein